MEAKGRREILNMFWEGGKNLSSTQGGSEREKGWGWGGGRDHSHDQTGGAPGDGGGALCGLLHRAPLLVCQLRGLLGNLEAGGSFYLVQQLQAVVPCLPHEHPACKT